MQSAIDLEKFIKRCINTGNTDELFLVIKESDNEIKKDFLTKYYSIAVTEKLKFLDLIHSISNPNMVLDIIKENNISDLDLIRKIIEPLRQSTGLIDKDRVSYYIDLRIKCREDSDFRFFDLYELKRSIEDNKKIIESNLLENFFFEQFLDHIDTVDLIEVYKLLESDKERYKVYSKVDYYTKDKLLKAKPFKELVYKMLIHQNDVTNSEIESLDIGTISPEIDPTITFGVELEAVTKNRTAQNLINKDKPYLFNGWSITEDCSILEIGEPNAGAEFVSPVLNYNSESLHNLKLVCETLKEFEYYTNSTCGGHIHLGFNYLKDAREVKTLINLYGVIEDFLYLASNKANSMLRKESLDVFAKSNCETIYNLKFNMEVFKDMDLFIYKFKREDKYTRERYYGLNLTNVSKENKNTIEFRMPNGEIEYTELKANIELFLSVFKLVKRIVNDKEIHDKYIELFNISDDYTRYEKILELLFIDKDTRDKYRERIITNDFENNKPEHYSVNLEDEDSFTY